MDAQRALLDQLMGQERNVEVEKRKGLRRRFSDDDIDKFYLCGCSPYELFKNTKSDLGENPKVIDEGCKAEWDALSQEEKDKYGYEYDTWQFLEKLVVDVDRKIWKNRQRTGDPGIDAYRDDAHRVLDIDDSILEMLHQVEQYASQGEIERAMQLQTQINVNFQLRSDLLKVPESQKKLLVCPVSGNLVSSADNDDRLRCHFVGKQYKGWKRIRAFLKKYRENPPPQATGSKRKEDLKPEPRDRKRQRSRSPRYNRSRSNERSHVRGRDRERNRGRDRDRERERDRDRTRDRDRDRDRHRSRERYRERSRKSRRRSRSRDRSRDRDYGRSRDRDRGSHRRR